jgi:hypothetical protein
MVPLFLKDNLPIKNYGQSKGWLMPFDLAKTSLKGKD